MRVPLSIVIPLCLAVIAGTWWFGTRNLDFLTTPSPARLAEIRQSVESALPPADQPDDAVSAPPPAPEPPPAPPEPPLPHLDPGDLNLPPALDEYHDLAAKGADHLIRLAVLLETEGESERALLAWERVLDATKPDNSQAIAALAAIKRLRPASPPWNKEPAAAIPITLHAGTSGKTATLIPPALEDAARKIEQASAGILKVTTHMTTGKTGRKSPKTSPVALWLAGATEDSPSSDVLSFTLESGKDLHEHVSLTVFLIIRSYLARISTPIPPREMGEHESAADALNSHITRRSWRELGTRLNTAPQKPD